MTCPSCGHQGSSRIECERCGIIYAKFDPAREHQREEMRLERRVFGRPIEGLLQETSSLLVDQEPREWWEILLNWEQANEYAVRDGMGRVRANVVEQGRGFGFALQRTLLGSHRPLDLLVTSFDESQIILHLNRPFFLLFSDMAVASPAGENYGRVQRRFAWIRSTYDLLDASGGLFGRIVRPVLSIWTFPVFDAAGVQRAEISKKWSGVRQEYFTDADKFRIHFMDDRLTIAQKAVIFAAALTIDYDFFENNSKR